MSRRIIKTIKDVSNELEAFICEDHKDLDANAKDIKDLPIIFMGKRTNRDQQWALKDIMELKDPANPKKGVRGMGVAFKYMWENLIDEVKNVLAPGDSFKGDEKNALWDSEGMGDYIDEAITHFYIASSLTDTEVKTSD